MSAEFALRSLLLTLLAVHAVVQYMPYRQCISCMQSHHTDGICFTAVVTPLALLLQGSIYHQLAAADSVDLEPPSTSTGSSSGNQAFSLHALSGDYRRIVHKPQGLTWKLLEYSDPDDPLALSELERLAGGQESAAMHGDYQSLVQACCTDGCTPPPPPPGPALPGPALRCPALPCPCLPCPALPSCAMLCASCNVYVSIVCLKCYASR